MQFYFLSVFLNLLVGVSLTFSSFKITELFPGKEKQFKIVVGIAAAFTGLMKFILVTEPGFVIIGDFIPAVVGIVGGVCYLIDGLNEKNEQTITMNPFFETLFVKGKKYVGIVCIAVAAIHFIFPTFPIL